MASSKSSNTGRRKSILARLPSLLTEAPYPPPRRTGSEPTSQRSEASSAATVGGSSPATTAGSSDWGWKRGEDASHKEDGVSRRKSRLGLLTSFLPSLTSQPAADPVPPLQQQQQQQQQQNQQNQQQPNPDVHRKSLPAWQGAPRDTLYDEQSLRQPAVDEPLPPAGLGFYAAAAPPPLSGPLVASPPPVSPPLVSPPTSPPPPTQHPPTPPVIEEPGVEPSLPYMLKKNNPWVSAPPQPLPSGSAPSAVPPSQPSPPIPSVTETQASPPRLRKTRERARSGSIDALQQHQQSSPQPHQPNRLQPRHGSGPSQPEPRGRSSSAQPPANRNSSALGPLDSPRVVSTPGDLRPNNSRPPSSNGSPTRVPDKPKLRKSWLPGGRSRSNSQDLSRSHAAAAWVMSPDSTAEYNTSFLTRGEKVPEIWNEGGDVYVFLCAHDGGLGPSFKVPAYIVSSSVVFNDMIQTDLAVPGPKGQARHFSGRDSLSAQDAGRYPPAHARAPSSSTSSASDHQDDEANVFLPVIRSPGAEPDLDRLVAIRNLFAFLTGQPLVATRAHPTLFAAFLQIAELLREFEFSNYDGSSFGEPVELAFGFYLSQLSLADVRHSREKTIEALILGEQMKSAELYNEAFAHAVGKYPAVIDLKSPLYPRVSVSTRNRLERAHLDLLNRQANVNNRLESFEFHGLFAGVASSTSLSEYKNVRFREWRVSFGRMRSFVLGYYKNLFGNWPPKARSKKNQFSESGLNRECLKILYADCCALYDLLADRTSLTPRVIDQPPDEIAGDDSADPRLAALRKILTEYDQSSPPVLPPIPYDVPKLPSMTAIREDYNELPPKQQAKFDKSVRANECMLILLKSRNIDVDRLRIPFLDAFKEFEHKEARGCTPQDMVDQRIGCWLFLYVVIQCLPMLVVDAPGLRFTDGAEYFLCEPPQGNLPWIEDAGEVRKVWYEVSGRQNIVALSADVVMFSVEATYHRSHCWQAAKQWEAAAANPAAAAAGATPPAPQEVAMPPLDPPRPLFQQLDAEGPGGGGNAGSGTAPAYNNSSGPPSAAGDGSDYSAPGSPALLPQPHPHPHHQPRNSSLGLPLPRPDRSSYRSSVVMGLEPLPLPADRGPPGASGDGGLGGGLGANPAGFPRPGSRPLSTLLPPAPHQLGMAKSVSVGNLNQLARESARGDEFAGAAGGPAPPQLPHQNHASALRKGSGSTFDDILKGMNQDKGKKKRFHF